MPTPAEQLATALKRHAPEFRIELMPEHIRRLADYYSLILKWNPRLHLVAPCTSEEFAVRHALESLILLNHLPARARVIDVGSGAGLPIIPCLLLREDLHAVLIEAARNKSVFLKEALRLLQLASRAHVLNARFEDAPRPDAEFITCRALDKFSQLMPVLVEWARPGSTVLLFAGESLANELIGMLSGAKKERIPYSERRFLVVGHG